MTGTLNLIEPYSDNTNLQCYDPSLSLNASSSRDYGIDKIRSQIMYDPELDEVAKIEASRDKGTNFVRMVYTYRSLSKAIPDVVRYKFMSYESNLKPIPSDCNSCSADF